MNRLKECPLSTITFDYLDFDAPAKLLSSRITSTSCVGVKEPFESDTTDVFGLFGPWGSGKSSLLALVREKSEGLVTWLDFDALKYQTETQILVPLLHRMAEECGSNDAARFFRGLVKSTGRFVSDVIVASSGLTIAKEIGLLIKSLRKIPKTEKETAETLPESRAFVIGEAFGKLAKELRKKRKKARLVIAIDNLDRCRPTALLEMLEAVHLILGANNVTFILAMDQSICIRSIEQRYGYSVSDSALYLEKMVPDYYRIADPWVGNYKNSTRNPDTILKFLRYMLDDTACKSFKAKERLLWEVIGSTTVLRNPRRIKRLLRRMSMLSEVWWKEHLDDCLAIVFLLTLSDIWPGLYFALPHTEPSEWGTFIEKTERCEKKRGPLAKLVDNRFSEFILALSSWKERKEGQDAPGFKTISKYDDLDALLGDIQRLGI